MFDNQAYFSRLSGIELLKNYYENKLLQAFNNKGCKTMQFEIQVIPDSLSSEGLRDTYGLEYNDLHVNTMTDENTH